MCRNRDEIGGFAYDDAVDPGMVRGKDLGTGATNLLVSYEHPDQSARPAMPFGREQADRLDHRCHGAFCVARPTPDEVPLDLAHGERIAGPALASGDDIEVGVEGEAPAGAVVDDGEEVFSASAHCLDLHSAAGSVQLLTEPTRGRRFVAGRVLGPEADQASEAGSQARGFRGQRPPPTNGLLRRSSPKVEPGPWPQMKATSSPSGNSFSLIEAISAAWSP